MEETNEMMVDYAVKISESIIDKAFESFKSRAGKLWTTVKIKTKAEFRAYYETSITKYSKIKTILNTLEPVDFFSLYVDIDLENQLNPKIQTDSLNDLFKLSKHLILQGTAGSGKSTLLKKLFLKSFDNGLKEIPLFIELRNVKFDEHDDLVDGLLKSLSYQNFNLEKNHFTDLLEHGKFILFLDGFDEISPSKQDLFSEQLLNICDKFNRNTIIITSRPNDSRFGSWHHFSVLNVKTFNKDKALELIEKLNYDQELKVIFKAKVESELYDKHKSFLSNPLLITIMIMTFNQYAEIPSKMFIFYQQAFEALFNKHDATKSGFKREHHTKLPIDDFTKVLSSFCFQAYYDEKINMDENTIYEYLKQTKNIYQSINFAENNFLNDLIDSVCILIKDGFIFGFTHRAFQEYFSALFLKNLDKDLRKSLFKELEHRMTNDNVMQLLFDMDRVNFEKEYVIPTLKQWRKLAEPNTDLAGIIFNKIFKGIIFKNKCINTYVIGNMSMYYQYIFLSNLYNIKVSYINENIETVRKLLTLYYPKMLDEKTEIPTKELLKAPDLNNEIHKLSLFYNQIVSLLDLQKRLENEHKDSKKSLKEIFQIK